MTMMFSTKEKTQLTIYWKRSTTCYPLGNYLIRDALQYEDISIDR